MSNKYDFCPKCRHWTLKILTWDGIPFFFICTNCWAHFPRSNEASK